MPFTVPDEVGSLYDIGLETRDGLTLSCLDRRGSAVAISKLGYVCLPGEKQEESTELQRKSQQVQLGPTIMDREWDQWVQQTQGAWSGGLGQRIQFGGAADASAFWDGVGIIWPINDWLPQSPFITSYKDVNSPTTPPGVPSYGGVVAGFIRGIGDGYAFTFQDVTPANELTFLTNTTRANATPPTNSGVANAGILDMAIGHGSIWIVARDNPAGTVALFYNNGAAFATQAKLANITAAGGVVRTVMATGNVANRQYVAVCVVQTGATLQDQISIFDVTANNATYTNNQVVALNVPYGWVCTQLGFSGDDLLVAMTDSHRSEIAAYNLASASWRTLANFDGFNKVYFSPVAGGSFIIASNDPSAGGRQAVHIYLLQGTTLQEFGPLIPQIGATAYPFVAALSRVTSFSSYAIFAVGVQDTIGGTVTLLLYAYDVLRGRLFKVAQTAGYDSGIIGVIEGYQIGAYRSQFRTSPTTYTTQWGVAVGTTLSGVFGSQNLAVHDIGIQKVSGNSGALLQQPVNAVSGLVDMTSAAVKLWRQVVARFTAMPNTVNASVTINAWLDQDPGNLAAVPDFTVTLVGNAVGAAGRTSLSLPINKVAVKMVYQIITTGGVYVAGWYDAPKIIAVSVQAATGWVHRLLLSLSRSQRTNSQGIQDYLFDHQNADEVVAYNFIRNLWRLRGGECKATFPNGDSYNALIQSWHHTAPKPFGTSFESSVPSDQYEGVGELLIREDL